MDGKRLSVLGQGTLNDSIQDFLVVQEVIVVQGVKHNCLLGMDFITNYVQSWNFFTNKLDFHEQMEDKQRKSS